MSDPVTMILAPTIAEGEAHADAHGLDRRDVVSPRSTSRVRDRHFDRLTIVNPDALDLLDHADIGELIRAFLKSTDSGAVAAVKKLISMRTHGNGKA